MLERIIRFSIEHRMLLVLLTMAAAGLGGYALQRLPIDAVPDITNKQVQINTEAAALSPVEIEKQVTFPIETALAGIPGLESTRSMSRNGFSQVTAVFRDHVDIYFARQQVNERLTEARESLPPGAEPIMGPISTGLGEVYMWTVEYASPKTVTMTDGMPGWQSDGTYLTPERQRLTNASGARHLPAHGAGLDYPPAAQERRGGGGRRCDWGLRQAVSRAARPHAARGLRVDVPGRH